MGDDLDIQLAGDVTWRNHARLGYTRLTRGVYGHAPRLDGLDRWERWRALHPVDHWLQLTGSNDELIEVADGLMRRQDPLISLEEFHRRLDALAGRPGVQRGRRLMRWVVPGTDSLYETRTRLVLVRAGLPSPAVNIPVRCRTGFVFHVDMGYEVEKVAVEFDGQGHVGDKRQMEIDAHRRRDIQNEGWFIITVTADMLDQPVDLVRTVEAALVMRRAALASKLK